MGGAGGGAGVIGARDVFAILPLSQHTCIHTHIPTHTPTDELSGVSRGADVPPAASHVLLAIWETIESVFWCTCKETDAEVSSGAH